MIFVLAPDSFKESLTAPQACAAMAAGIKKVMPSATCISVPMADGGEGTMLAIVAATGGEIFSHRVTGPLGHPVEGEYGILGDNQTGVVELASASGLHLVSASERNPLITSTYGTGELIKQVLTHGVKKLIVCIGGSATNDGGVGLAQALGVKFLNAQGKEIDRGGGNLNQIHFIDVSDLIAIPNDLVVEVACDVTNPLTGINGASAIFGPQKGATPEMVTQLDANLEHYAAKIKTCLGKDIKDIPGAGAAGGAGTGLMAFLNANLVSGIELVIKYTGLEEKIRQANFVFTGEGSIDSQTVDGKTISGVVALAKKHQKPIIAFAGRIKDTEALYQMGLTAIFGILPGLVPLEEALQSGEQNLEQAARSVAGLLLATNTI